MSELKHLTEDERAMLKRCEKATPGPWEQVNDHVFEAKGNEQVAACDHRKNAQFVTSARADVPELLRRLSAARAQLAEQRNEALEWIAQQCESKRGELVACEETTPAIRALTDLAAMARAGKSVTK